MGFRLIRFARALIARNKNAAMLVLALEAAGYPAQAQNQNVGNVTTASVILEGNMVVITADRPASSQCQNSGMIVLSEDAQLRDRFLSVAMTAMSANMKVGIWVLGHCAPTSWGPTRIAYHLQLVK